MSFTNQLLHENKITYKFHKEAINPKSRTILITGFSSGIGYRMAKELTQRGYTVFGTVSNEADSQKLKSELGDSFVPLNYRTWSGSDSDPG